MQISETYNMDCMEYMRQFPDKYFQLSIVDPPYGSHDAINPISSANKYKTKRGNYKEFDNIAPDDEYFFELYRVSKNQIVWGGNFFGLCGGAIVWQKKRDCFW